MTEELSTEERAKAQGWNPNYKGENAKTAEQFIEDGKKITPIQAERMKALEEKIISLEKTSKENARELLAQQQKVLREQREIGRQKALKEIEERKKVAREEADVEALESAIKDENKIKQSEEKESVTEKKPVVTKEFKEFAKNNPWYDKNLKDPISLYADSYGARLATENRFDNLTDLLKEVEKETKLRFPEISGTKTPPIDDSNHTTTKKAGEKTYDNLPKEAKKACDMMVEKYGIKKEEYVENFDWGN